MTVLVELVFVLSLCYVGFLSFWANWAIVRHGGDSEYTQRRIRRALGVGALWVFVVEVALLLRHNYLRAALIPVLATAVVVLARYYPDHRRWR